MQPLQAAESDLCNEDGRHESALKESSKSTVTFQTTSSGLVEPALAAGHGVEAAGGDCKLHACARYILES